MVSIGDALDAKNKNWQFFFFAREHPTDLVLVLSAGKIIPVVLTDMNVN